MPETNSTEPTPRMKYLLENNLATSTNTFEVAKTPDEGPIDSVPGIERQNTTRARRKTPEVEYATKIHLEGGSVIYLKSFDEPVIKTIQDSGGVSFRVEMTEQINGHVAMLKSSAIVGISTYRQRHKPDPTNYDPTRANYWFDGRLN